MALVFHAGFEGGNLFEFPTIVGSPSVVSLPYIGQTISYGGTIYSIAIDETHIYVGGITTNTVKKYLKSDLSYIGETVSYGGGIRSIAIDETHIYVGGDTTNTVRKYLKSDLSYIGQTTSYGGTIYSIAIDATHIYVGGDTTNTVRKYLKSDLSYIGQTTSYGATIRSIAIDATHIYVGGGITNVVKKYLKSDLSYIGQTISYGGEIYSIAIDATHIYAGGITTNTVKKYLKSNFSYIGQTVSYGGAIFSIAIDATHIYAGGAIQTVKKYLKSDLSYIGGTASYGDVIRSIAIDATHIYVGGDITTNTVRKYLIFDPKTGTYAMRCNTAAATAYVTSPVKVFYRGTCWLHIGSSPSAETRIIAGWNGAVDNYNVRLTADRYLKLYNADTLVGTGGTQLATGTWYRISFASNNIYLNGNAEITGSFTPAGDTLRVGIGTAVTADLYFDDVAFDDVSSTTIDLGDIRTLLSLPNVQGTYYGFDTEAPVRADADHYLNYDDPAGAISDADYVQQAGKTAVRDTAGLQDCSTIGIGASDTINAVNVLARMMGATTCGITVRDNGTDFDYAKALNKAATWFSQYFALMPRTGTPVWSQAGVNAFEAGAFHTLDQGTDTFLYALMVMVAYTPSVGPPYLNQYNKILYASEPPTPNAWNQAKQDAGTGWKKLLYV